MSSLEIPPSVNIDSIGLQTEPGRQLAWTLQNYRAYVVDSMGAAFGISDEEDFNGSKPAEFRRGAGLGKQAIASTSSRQPKCSSATGTTVRAGLAGPNTSAYTELNAPQFSIPTM